MIQKKVRNLLSVVLALLLCLGSLTPAFAAKNNVQADPDAELSVLDMANVDTLSGYLYERSQKNYDRLESDPYLLPSVLEGDPNWPGDYQGRALLGIISEAKANQDRAPQNLEAMMQALPDKLLDGCFFNETLNPDMINEQLMAGHSWFLRAMCELYEWNQDPRALEIIEGLVNKLLIPAKDGFARYPIIEGGQGGGESGEIIGEEAGWKLSTDTGCVFIMLDGATHAYQITKNEELRSVIEIMIEKFMQEDVRTLKFQTHATLSATRGILRFYGATHEQKYLDYAVQRMEEYVSSGMTETYMNYNWYQRPEWTEPCAIIDSYIASMELFRYTQDVKWLELAQKILLNGMGAGQRSNGGFGTDTCCGVTSDSLDVSSYEATWCCTMRGGEGMGKALGYQYMTDAQGRLYVLQYSNNRLTFASGGGETVLQQTSGYPENGDVQFAVESSTASELTMRLFIPSYVDLTTLRLTVDGMETEANVENGFLEISFDPTTVDEIALHFDIPVIRNVTMPAEDHMFGYTYSKGFALLGWFNGPGTDVEGEQNLPFEERTLKPIYEAFHLSQSDRSATSIQVVDTPNKDMSISTGAAVSASSSYEADGWGISGLVDGAYTNGWSSMPGRNQTEDSTEWVQVDLGGVCSIQEILLYPSDNLDGAMMPVDYEVLVSADGNEWTPVKQVEGDTVTSKPRAILFDEPVEAGYIRVVGTKLRLANETDGYLMQIGELEVYSDDVVMLQIASNDPMAYAAVRINGGDEKILPYTGAFREGQELTIEPVILNEADYGFFSWSGDVSSDEETISLTMDSDHSLVLNQAPAISENLALHAAVNAKNTIESLPDWSTSNLTDGVLLTPGDVSGSKGYTSAATTNPDVSADPYWVEVDLGENTEFNRVHLYPRSDYFAADGSTCSFPEDFTISVRKDGEDTYTVIGTYHDVVAPEYYRPAVYTFDEMQDARYIRVTVNRIGKLAADTTTNYMFQLSEMGVYRIDEAQDTYQLYLEGTPGGKISVNGELVSLPYSQEYAKGDRVTIKAIETTGTFIGWEGSQTGTDSEIYLIMNGDQSIHANFQYGNMVPNSSMTVEASSETNPQHDYDGPASFAIDGNIQTLWHSRYDPQQDPLPVDITLRFDTVRQINQFVYVPRQTPGQNNGIITKYRLEIQAADGTWTQVSEGDWALDMAEKTVEFSPTEAQAVRLTAMEGYGGFASAAELRVYEVPAVYTVSGCVLAGETGVDVGGIPVYLYTAGNPDQAIDLTTTDAEGNFTFTDVKAGDYLVQVNAVEGAYLASSVAVTVSDGDVTDADLTLRGQPELTVTFPKTVKLSIDGQEQTIANLLGKYSANVMADTELNLAFAPRVEGREIAGVTVNGEAIAEDSFDVSEYVYSAAMPNADTTIELGFTVVDKQNLRAAIEIAEGRADEADAAVPSVKEKYEAALQAAKDVEAKKTATQDEIDTAWSDLIDALHYLSFAAGDKSQLDIPMEIADSINRDLFTPDSLKALDEAYAAAEDLLDDEEVLEADITAAVDALYDAIYGLVYRADVTELEALVTKGDSIVANVDQYIQNDAWTSFETSLEEAKTVLANENATQDAVDTAAEDLAAAISALRLIPDKDALEALIGEAEAINTNKYTATSVATMKAALSTAKAVLNDAEATKEEVADAVEALENSIDGLVEKSTSTGSKNSGSTSANVGNAYGAAGVVSASQSVAANAYVVSDTTVNFTLKHGQAYCFKMTVVNGNNMVPGFTAGNGEVLKTQFVAKIGNDYYYRVYAIGTPGQSTGVYTTLPGNAPVKHCAVTIG